MFNNYTQIKYPQGHTSNSPMPTPPRTASTLNTPQIQQSFDKTKIGPINDTNTTRNHVSSSAPVQDDNSDSDASSELEEGEIDERSLPPPTLRNPVPIVPLSSRRFRAESSFRPQRKDPPEPNYYVQPHRAYEYPSHAPPSIPPQSLPPAHATSYSPMTTRYLFDLLT